MISNHTIVERVSLSVKLLSLNPVDVETLGVLDFRVDFLTSFHSLSSKINS